MGTQGDATGPRGGTTRLLLEAARGGDAGAQGQLLSRFEPVLRACVQAHLGSERFRAEGDDLLQEVRLGVVRALPALRATARPALVAWLRRVARSRAIDWERRQKPGRGRPVRRLSATNAPEVACSREAPSRVLVRREDLEKLRGAVERVPDRYRKVLELVLTEFPDTAELAARLGCGTEAARKLMERALEALRKAVRRDGR